MTNPDERNVELACELKNTGFFPGADIEERPPYLFELETRLPLPAIKGEASLEINLPGDEAEVGPLYQAEISVYVRSKNSVISNTPLNKLPLSRVLGGVSGSLGAITPRRWGSHGIVYSLSFDIFSEDLSPTLQTLFERFRDRMK